MGGSNLFFTVKATPAFFGLTHGDSEKLRQPLNKP
ncbi:hypothetical protein EMIT0357P_20626 [Pseudomonas marginalis]